MKIRILFGSIAAIIIILPCMLSGQFRFDLGDGQRWSYRIDIETEKRVEISRSDGTPDSQKMIFMNTDIALYLTIFVIENYDNEYALISCVYDSLSGSLKSGVDGTPTEIGLRAERDHIRLYQDDTLASEFTPGFTSDKEAAEFYEKLIFIGEDIRMLAYPTGEIINVTENKNLWQLAQEFTGGLGDGFLQVVFPENARAGANWEQAVSRDDFGGFELKQRFEPLLLQYRLPAGAETIEFKGELAIDSFSTAVEAPELSDELTLIINNYDRSAEGSAAFEGTRGFLSSLAATTIERANYRLLIRSLADREIFSSQYLRKEIKYTLLKK